MSLECRSADLCFLRLKTVDLIMGGSRYLRRIRRGRTGTFCGSFFL